MNFLLPSIRALEQLKDPFPHREGIQKILGDDLQVYFTKHGDTPEVYRQLNNEFICNRMLTLWGIPTPGIAVIEGNDSLSTLPEGAAPAMGSRSLGPTATELSSLFVLRSQTDLKRLANPADLFKIGLFDIWVENRNRKESRLNLMINHERNYWKIYAIDHGSVLMEGPIWRTFCFKRGPTAF